MGSKRRHVVPAHASSLHCGRAILSATAPTSFLLSLPLTTSSRGLVVIPPKNMPWGIEVVRGGMGVWARPRHSAMRGAARTRCVNPSVIVQAAPTPLLGRRTSQAQCDDPANPQLFRIRNHAWTCTLLWFRPRISPVRRPRLHRASR
jgi:hypothetical protein